VSEQPAGDCLDCSDDSEHCHWAWVRHPDGHGECLALECRFGPDAHVVVISCVDVEHGCCA
jgi:hypothetical protein